MKLVIHGTAYPVEDAFTEPTVAQSMRIVKETGLSIAEIARRFGEMAQAADNESVQSDPRLMEGFVAFIWLVRSAAGERITYGEAADFKWSDWHFEFDPAEVAVVEDAAPDPTSARTDSVPGVDADTAPTVPSGKTRSSKTSGKRSTRA